ncbi:hypothetical protein DL96DRAFT_789854 [Flagelloscypha sp. PMI_526]|nr:hypothetical protein DL96DRAFT_789854 [Flagelloscypha sp. PMI_526]
MAHCESVHPRLRCFKWTTMAGYGSPSRFTLHSRPFSPLMNSAASQLTCVHFNPLPNGIDLNSFDVTGLTELRINFSDPTFEEIQAFHRLLEGVERLETIEVIGLKVPPLELRGVHTHLRKMYLEVKPSEFLQALTVLPTKAPNLERLVLVVDGWCSASDRRRGIRLVADQIDASDLSSISKWGVWDLGIIMTRCSLAWSVETFPEVMKAISRKLPNIRSFYGTGKLLVYKGLEKNIDDDWVGEFCGSPAKV